MWVYLVSNGNNLCLHECTVVIHGVDWGYDSGLCDFKEV